MKRPDVQQAVQPAWMGRQAAADQQRVEWLLARRQEGATLVLVGLDSWRFALLERFTDKEFATTDPARWALCVLGKKNGKYTEARVFRTEHRLLTTKGLDTLAEALNVAAETDK